MTRPPFRPLDRRDLPPDADPVVRELESYTALTAGEHPHGLADRVMAAVADEPRPRRGFLAGLLAPFEAGRGGGMTRMILVTATMALAVLAVVLAGQLANLLLDDQIGPSPVPSVELSPTPSATESPSPSPSATESPTSRQSRTPRPSPNDDESPEASESPDDDDNSGPGGGGGDDDDNSGPGGGGSSGDSG